MSAEAARPPAAAAVGATSAASSDNNPQGRLTGESASVEAYIEASPAVNQNSDAITAVGGSRSHTNLMPFLCVHFIVSLVGIYPSRH